MKWCSSRATTATTQPAAIRLNYGMQRHAGGGIAARTIACLPALVGAWRDAAGGIVLTTRGFLQVRPRRAGAARPHSPGAAAHDQPVALGDALDRGRAAGASAIYRLQQQPGRGVPGLGQGDRRLLARGSVHRRASTHFQTDTADYADIVLPATTQLEHYDVHKSYGHLYVLGQQPRHRAGGRVDAEYRSVPPARGAHGLRRAVLPRLRRGCRAAGARFSTAYAGIDWEAAQARAAGSA